MNKFVVIDGNSIAYRAFYALPVLSNTKGLFTNAIFGFINMFFKIVDDLKPTHLAVVFDYPAKTFRNALYSEYKATRKQMPSELAEQIPVIKDVLKMLGCKVFEQEGFEADDIVGTLAKKFKMQTIIITGDRDCLQLIDDSTNVLLTKRGLTETILMNDATFKEEYGFKPVGIVDLKAIMGDASDNIPGVKGIGEKGAKNLIQKYRTLENVYAHIDEISGKAQRLLLEQKEMANLSLRLATINTKMDLDVVEKDVKFTINLGLKVKEKFEDLEFYAILKRKEFLSDKIENVIKKNSKHFKNFEIKSIEDFDILNNLKNEIAVLFLEDSIQIADSENLNYTINIKKDLIDDGLDFRTIINLLKNKLEDENIKKICFDFKKEKKFLEEFNIDFKGLSFDVHLAHWLINSDDKCEDILKFFEKTNSNEISARNLFAVKNDFDGTMDKMGLSKLYYDIELPLVGVLIDMENNGIKISGSALESILFEYQCRQKELEEKIYKQAGMQFNINSPKQLGKVLFEILGLKSGKKQSTSVDVLMDLKNDNEIIPYILEYRTISKIVSTYLLGFKDFIDNGFVHTTYNQTGTATGRLSSQEPNLQNIPVKKEEGKILRRMFVSRFENGKIVSADYNQIELRLVASLTQDEKMIAAFNSGKDIHKSTASEIFNVPIDDVDSKLRSRAKAVNFGIVYGISPYGLSEQIGVKPNEAGEYIKKYFASFPKIKDFMNGQIEDAKQNGGIVRTMFGRIRNVKEILSGNKQIAQFGERAVMNMPFQGTASDIIKIAMIKVYNRMKNEHLKSKLILQVHDELIVDACSDEVEKIEQILKKEMQNVVKLSVELSVDVESGETWFEV